MSNLWFFRLHGGSSQSSNDRMERRRSSSERSAAAVTAATSATAASGDASQVQVELVQSFGGSSNYKTSATNATSMPLSSTMSRLHSARSSTASYCAGMLGIYGDVPPLHRKSFLSTGGNMPNADSLDNVAQLIPRFVYARTRTTRELLVHDKYVSHSLD